MPSVEIRAAHDRDACAAIEAVLNDVWMVEAPASVYPSGVLLTMAHCGLCVAGAWDDRRCVGAVVGFLAVEDGELTARLDYLGVVADLRDRHVSRPLWDHFVTWARATPARSATWTFDPCEQRNAHLYLNRIGGVAVDYVADAYGVRDDGLNAGEPSDRLLTRLELDGDGPPLDDVRRWVGFDPGYTAMSAGAARAQRDVLRAELAEAYAIGERIVAYDRELGYGLA